MGQGREREKRKSNTEGHNVYAGKFQGARFTTYFRQAVLKLKGCREHGKEGNPGSKNCGLFEECSRKRHEEEGRMINLYSRTVGRATGGIKFVRVDASDDVTQRC